MVDVVGVLGTIVFLASILAAAKLLYRATELALGWLLRQLRGKS
jgi:hypothetical protein